MKDVRTGFIPEIQGLRTIALLMVATFHIWFGKVSGGVDIFLLVSSYLMTRSLTARSETGALTRPITYLIRKFSRLLPAATAAIVLILIAVLILLPVALWEESISSSLSSIFYVENLRLQDASVNYFTADHSTASPFQHFWSLSVQGQVFVLFAILHFLGDLVARWLKRPIRKVLLVLFAVLAVVSFVYSIWLTDQNQAFAYFDTGARVWEFAVGSVLALIHPWLRVSQGFQTVASWVGVVAMLACGFVLPVESSFPGWAALWPVAAASLVIIAAGAPTRFGADRILATGVLHTVGDYTYALYLIHWPVLVFYLYLSDTEHADPLEGLFILGISVLLSFIITSMVEQTTARWLKRDRPSSSRWLPRTGWRSPLTIAVCVGLALSLVEAGNAQLQRQLTIDQTAIEESTIAELGANALWKDLDVDELVPGEAFVTDDWVSAGPDCSQNDPYLTPLCYEISAVDGPAERVVYSIGSSHSTQFNGALLEAVNRHPDWAFRTQLAAGCYFESRVGIGEECTELWDQAARYIAAEKPDLVVLFGTQTYEDFEMTQPELVDWLAGLQADSPDTQFVAVRDNPRITTSLFECATRFGYASEQCVYEFTTSADPWYVEDLEVAGAIWVDLNDYICPGRECRPARGGAVVYLDESHLTGTYVRTLAQRFSDAIQDDVEWWPEYVYEEGTYVDRSSGNNVLEDLNG